MTVRASRSRPPAAPADGLIYISAPLAVSGTSSEQGQVRVGSDPGRIKGRVQVLFISLVHKTAHQWRCPHAVSHFPPRVNRFHCVCPPHFYLEILSSAIRSKGCIVLTGYTYGVMCTMNASNKSVQCSGTPQKQQQQQRQQRKTENAAPATINSNRTVSIMTVITPDTH